jgi:hypothetical protein
VTQHTISTPPIGCGRSRRCTQRCRDETRQRLGLLAVLRWKFATERAA